MATIPTIYDLINANKGKVDSPWGLMSPDVTYKQYTEDEANKTFDIVRNIPEFQDQKNDVSDMEQELGRLKKLPQVSGDSWVKPLLALADSETGSRLSAGYQDNDISQKTNDMIMKYQQAIGDRKKQSADTLMSSLGKFKSGVTTTKDTGISPLEQAKLDFQTGKQEQDAIIKMMQIEAQKNKGSGRGKIGYVDKKAVDTYGSGKTNYESMISSADRIVEVAGELKKLDRFNPANVFARNKLITELQNLNLIANAPNLKPLSDSDSKTLKSDAWLFASSDEDNYKAAIKKANTLKKYGSMLKDTEEAIYEGDSQGYGAAKIVEDIKQRYKDENATQGSGAAAKPSQTGAPDSGFIIRVAANGKKYKFDAKTKKNLGEVK